MLEAGVGEGGPPARPPRHPTVHVRVDRQAPPADLASTRPPCGRYLQQIRAACEEAGRPSTPAPLLGRGAGPARRRPGGRAVPRRARRTTSGRPSSGPSRRPWGSSTRCGADEGKAMAAELLAHHAHDRRPTRPDPPALLPTVDGRLPPAAAGPGAAGRWPTPARPCEPEHLIREVAALRRADRRGRGGRPGWPATWTSSRRWSGTSDESAGPEAGVRDPGDGPRDEHHRLQGRRRGRSPATWSRSRRRWRRSASWCRTWSDRGTRYGPGRHLVPVAGSTTSARGSNAGR